MIRTILTIYLSIIYIFSFGQNTDTIRVLPELIIMGAKAQSDIHQMPQIAGTNIYAAKKSALILMENVQGNIATNTMRQVMAKVPGINIWESESSGVQINISSRGLSPNRSWEFNVRQNGYDIAADPYGYPEAYYNPQLQSVKRIEVVRGHGSLQYGPQVGGMVNYVLKDGSEFTKSLQMESAVTAGSFGLIDTYAGLGGKKNKFHYYSFFDHRSGTGYRQNNNYSSTTGSGSIHYKANNKLTIGTAFTQSNTVSQQPGGLTDEQFSSDPTQSFRNRNWLGLIWNMMEAHADLSVNALTKFSFKLFNVSGQRRSIGFVPAGGILVADTINTDLGKFNPRTLDIDHYNNTGFEARSITYLSLGKISNTISSGLRIFQGTTSRYRGGVGSNETDADFNPATGSEWHAELKFNSRNAAIFVEDLITLNEKLFVIPGIRMEFLNANASGYNGFQNGNRVPIQDLNRTRKFILSGIGIEYAVTPTTKIYFNSTQSFRPVLFSDLTASPTTDVIDGSMKDAQAVNTDLGYRGNAGDYLIFDISAFRLNYRNRIGTIKQQRTDGSFYNYRTNIGQSISSGIEAFTEVRIARFKNQSGSYGNAKIFVSGNLMDARYGDFKQTTLNNNILVESNLKNKKVEYAPKQILRTGLSLSLNRITTSIQYSHTSAVYSDANNTITPNANGQNGRIPAYGLLDWNASLNLNQGLSLRAGINNISNEKYFTRRSGGYPGPGLLPGDGRNYFVSLNYRMQ